MSVLYESGPGWAVVTPRLVVLTRDERPDALANVWELAQGGDLAVLDVVGTLAGGDLARLSDFALVLLEGVPRALVRGEGIAIVTTRSSEERWAAADVSTWAERRLPSDVISVTLTWKDAAQVSLPIVEGVVPAAAVCVPLGSAPVVPDAPVSEPSPTVELVGEPDLVMAPEPKVEPELQVEPQVESRVESQVERDPQVDREPLVEPEPPEARSRETVVDPVGESYDALFGASVARRPEDAAVRPLEEEQVASEPADLATDPELEHDGMTIAGRSRQDLVVARPLVSQAPSAHMRVSARLELSDGRIFTLDRPVYVGRAPEALGASIDALPQLVTVDSPEHEISRTHVQVRLEGEDVLVRDVSSNGTLLTRPGQEPERLPAQRDTLLTHGSQLLLGDDVSISVSIERGA
jgi:hypothetical protein